MTDLTELGSLQNESLLTSREPSMIDADHSLSAQFDHPQPSGIPAATFLLLCNVILDTIQPVLPNSSMNFSGVDLNFQNGNLLNIINAAMYLCWLLNMTDLTEPGSRQDESLSASPKQPCLSDVDYSLSASSQCTSNVIVPTQIPTVSLVENCDCNISFTELADQLSLSPLPSPWIIFSPSPLILCRMKVSPQMYVVVELTLRIDSSSKWTLFFREYELSLLTCPLLIGLPLEIKNAESVHLVVQRLDSSKVCAGNPEDQYVVVCQQRAVTLHGISG